MQNKKALLVLDLINEVVHPEGKYAAEGYYEQVRQRHVLQNAEAALRQARVSGMPVIFVVVGFSESYVECPDNSPVFGMAKKEKRITLGTWGTEVFSTLKPMPSEPVVVKNRINPFFQTNLDLVLRQLQVDTLVLCGVSTEFVILSTAMAAHDRDYNVIVLEDATASSTEELHAAALKIAARTASIRSVADVFQHME